MKILHYALGFPPYRTGGLTKYCMDLMAEQKRQGDDVSMMWPGKITNSSETKIVKRKNKDGFGNYEMINPMPVPLLKGIKNIEAFTHPTDKSVYVSFLEKYSCDVIHLHTLMGLPKEFLEAAKELGIKTVFTSHDYFGLCPKVSLLYNERYCEYDESCSRCEECNKNAISLDKIKIQQGGLYRTLKQSKMLNKLKKFNHKPVQITGNGVNATDGIQTQGKKSEPYMALRKYYLDMLEMVTKIHFNSSTTEKTYRDFKVRTPGEMISISHGGIKDLRKKRQYGEKIRFGYLGPASIRKGFFLLKDVLDGLQEEYKDKFELHIYSKNSFDCDYIVGHKPYAYSEMPQVMDSIDILVLPSIWHETFGFTVLEALSYGVPVMVSENVGAQDIIEDYKSGIVFNATHEDLESKVRELLDKGSELLENMNDFVCSSQKIITMEVHAREMREFYNC